MSTKSSIENLKIYQLARKLEDQTYELVKGMPEGSFYPLGNSLRRASTAVAHYISEAHDRYSYSIKIQSLQYARIAAEESLKLLEEFKGKFNGATEPLSQDFNVVIRQSWGLIRYFKNQQTKRQAEAGVKAADELVAARA